MAKFRITEPGVYVDEKRVPVGEEITVKTTGDEIPAFLVGKAELVARAKPGPKTAVKTEAGGTGDDAGGDAGYEAKG